MTATLTPTITITIAREGERFFYSRAQAGRELIEQAIDRSRARQIIEHNPNGRTADGVEPDTGPIPCRWHWSVNVCAQTGGRVE